jgi:hypothetical protein
MNAAAFRNHAGSGAGLLPHAAERLARQTGWAGEADLFTRVELAAFARTRSPTRLPRRGPRARLRASTLT